MCLAAQTWFEDITVNGIWYTCDQSYIQFMVEFYGQKFGYITTPEL